MNIRDWLHRKRPAGPDGTRLRSIEWREFAPALFTWYGRDQTLQLTIQLSGMRYENGTASVELQVLDHGLQIACVLEGSETDANLYLGNWFIVPPQLRRRGLASAVLLACLQTFQQAAFGRQLSTQRVRLEGYFVDEGAAFSRAACHGIQPTKARPALMDLERMKRSAQKLQMDTPPRSLN